MALVEKVGSVLSGEVQRPKIEQVFTRSFHNHVPRYAQHTLRILVETTLAGRATLQVCALLTMLPALGSAELPFLCAARRVLPCCGVPLGMLFFGPYYAQRRGAAPWVGVSDERAGLLIPWSAPLYLHPLHRGLCVTTCSMYAALHVGVYAPGIPAPRAAHTTRQGTAPRGRAEGTCQLSCGRGLMTESTNEERPTQKRGPWVEAGTRSSAFVDIGQAPVELGAHFAVGLCLEGLHNHLASLFKIVVTRGIVEQLVDCFHVRHLPSPVSAGSPLPPTQI